MLWVVSGTGTGVGKTSVAVGLLRALVSTGHRVAGWKPVETGVAAGLGPDQRALLAESTFHVKHEDHHAFPVAAAPHLAARAAGVAIAPDPIVALARRLRREYSVVLELAGGLFSPLTDDCLNADLVLALAPDRHLVVAPDRLGVLHDAIATTTAAAQKGVAPSLIIVSQCTPVAPALGNTRELQRYVPVPVLGPLGYGDPGPRADQLRSMLAGWL